MGLADEVSKDRGQPATVRIGEVTSLLPFVVSVQGRGFANVGVLNGYIPAVGDVVAVLGQSAVSADGSSWLVLGRIVLSTSTLLSAVTRGSGVQTGTVSTASAVYVTLGGAAAGVSFTAPASGRVMVHWRVSVLPAVTFVAWTSFMLSTGSTVGAGTVVQASADTVALQMNSAAVVGSDTGTMTLVSGLAPGGSYNVVMQHRTTGGTAFYGNREIVVEPVP